MLADVPVLVRLWDVFDLAICADGGANRLYDGLQALDPTLVAKCVPTFIKGDLDSVRSDVEAFYRSSKCRVVRDPDQDTNDLEKCLQLVQALCRGKQPTGIEDTAENADGVFNFPQLQNKENSITVVVFGAFGGRFDQQIATLHAIYLYADFFDRLVLLGDGNCATLLRPLSSSSTGADTETDADADTLQYQEKQNILEEEQDKETNTGTGTGTGGGGSSLITHCLHLIPGVEGPSCSLLPVGGRCDVVSTTGLKWNLASQSLALGELISTSNRVVCPAKTDAVTVASDASEKEEKKKGSKITVQTSQPLLWCCQVNLNNACIGNSSCI